MKNIIGIMLLAFYLFLVIFTPTVAQASPKSNNNYDSISWWLDYAVKQVDTITAPDCKDAVYGHLGRAQALAGDVDGANASAAAISTLNTRIYIYNYAAKTFYSQGNMPGYKKSIEQAKSAALSVVHIEHQIFMNSNVIRTYLECKDVDGAKSFTASINNRSQKVQAYKKIAAYFACNNDIENTDAILEKIENPAAKETALVEITETCVRKENLPIAEQMAKRLDGSKYKSRVYAKLGIAFVKNGEIKKARATAEIITDPIHKSSVIAEVAKYHIISGDLKLGKKIAMDISYRDHKTSVYSLIAEKQVDAGEIDSTLLTIKTMVKMIKDIPMPADESKFGKFDDSFKKSAVEMVYLRVAMNLAKKNDIEGYNKYIAKAIASVKQIDIMPLWKGVLFVNIIVVQLEASDVNGAKQTAKEISNEMDFSYALYNIVNAQLENDDTVGAVATYREMTHASSKSSACGLIASAFIKKDDIAKAKQMLSSSGNSSREAMAYRDAAKVFVEMGKTKELANWLNEIPTPQARVLACLGAIDGIRATTPQED